VRGIRTTIVLETIAERTQVPFGNPSDETEGDLPSPVLAAGEELPPPSLLSLVERRARESV
jgi:hypothetical protein